MKTSSETEWEYEDIQISLSTTNCFFVDETKKTKRKRENVIQREKHIATLEAKLKDMHESTYMTLLEANQAADLYRQRYEELMKSHLMLVEELARVNSELDRFKRKNIEINERGAFVITIK